MSFETGKLNFSIIELPEGSDRGKLLNNIVCESYSNTRPTMDEAVVDFTSGVSLAPGAPADFDEEQGVSEADFVLGGLPYFAIRKQELKIDSKIVKETVDRRLFDLEKEGQKITSEVKRDVKETVALALESKAVEKMSGIRCVVSADGRYLFVDATSPKKVDETVIEHMLTSVETGTFGPSSANSIIRMSPEYLFMESAKREWSSYIPMKMNQFVSIEGIGHDFLTYLFMSSEVEGFFEDDSQIVFSGNIELEDCRESQTGAKKITLKEGAPSISNEVVTALLSGKKVKSADLKLHIDGQVYEFTVDNDFVFKKFTFEDSKDLDVHSLFEERMTTIVVFIEKFKKLFNQFVSTESTNEAMVLRWLERKQERSQ